MTATADGRRKTLLTLWSTALLVGTAHIFVLVTGVRRELSSIVFADMSSSPLACSGMLQ